MPTEPRQKEQNGASLIAPGLLSDIAIKELLRTDVVRIQTHGHDIISFDPEKQIQPGSIDLHFRNEYKRFSLDKDDTLTFESIKLHNYTTPYELQKGENLRLEPGEAVLTTTLEHIRLPSDIAGIITGRSSIARLGVMVHCCQEFINPGHEEAIALQIINLSPCCVELDPNVSICQLILLKMSSTASQPYSKKAGAKYSNESSPQTSKIYEETASSPNQRKNQVLSSDSVKKGTIVFDFLNIFIMPFLPTLIMVSLVTPVFIKNSQSLTIDQVVSAIESLPSSIIFGIFCIALYILLKVKDKK